MCSIWGDRPPHARRVSGCHRGAATDDLLELPPPTASSNAGVPDRCLRAAVISAMRHYTVSSRLTLPSRAARCHPPSCHSVHTPSSPPQSRPGGAPPAQEARPPSRASSRSIPPRRRIFLRRRRGRHRGGRAAPAQAARLWRHSKVVVGAKRRPPGRKLHDSRPEPQWAHSDRQTYPDPHPHPRRTQAGRFSRAAAAFGRRRADATATRRAEHPKSCCAFVVHAVMSTVDEDVTRGRQHTRARRASGLWSLASGLWPLAACRLPLALVRLRVISMRTRAVLRWKRLTWRRAV